MPLFLLHSSTPGHSTTQSHTTLNAVPSPRTSNVPAQSHLPCLRASYQVCARRAGRGHLLAYMWGGVDQWRAVVAKGPSEGPLPAAARTALAEAAAAAALQAALDVAQLGCQGAYAGLLRVGCRDLGFGALGRPTG